MFLTEFPSTFMAPPLFNNSNPTPKLLSQILITKFIKVLLIFANFSDLQHASKTPSKNDFSPSNFHLSYEKEKERRDREREEWRIHLEEQIK